MGLAWRVGRGRAFGGPNPVMAGELQPLALATVRPFPVPAVAIWPNVTIRFVDDDTVDVVLGRSARAAPPLTSA